MKRLRILVIEDDPMIALLLGEVLKEMGHDVCAIVGSEKEAIAAALRCQPDLMMVDDRLDGGSGLRVVDVVLGHGYVPHIFVSGDAMNIKRRRPDAIVMEKPYFETDLALAIERTMRRDPGAPIRQAGPPRISALAAPGPIPPVDGVA